jgi:hypothetical protein
MLPRPWLSACVVKRIPELELYLTLTEGDCQRVEITENWPDEEREISNCEFRIANREEVTTKKTDCGFRISDCGIGELTKGTSRNLESGIADRESRIGWKGGFLHEEKRFVCCAHRMMAMSMRNSVNIVPCGTSCGTEVLSYVNKIDIGLREVRAFCQQRQG